MGYLRLARLYQRTRHHGEAAQVPREGLRIAPPGAPEAARTHDRLGTTPVALGRPADAARGYEAALEAEPELVEAMFSLGMTYAERPGHRDDAIRWLRRFVGRASASQPAEYVRAARQRPATLQAGDRQAARRGSARSRSGTDW